MQPDSIPTRRFSDYNRRRGIVQYDGFYLLKESLTKAKAQLAAIHLLSPIQKQFIGTMVDTEVAVGYQFRRYHATSTIWVAYLAVKM